MFRANRFDWLNLGVEDNEENTIAWKKFKNVEISLDPYKRKKIILKIPVKKKRISGTILTWICSTIIVTHIVLDQNCSVKFFL